MEEIRLTSQMKMREYENLVGKRYGKLIVKELLPSNGSGHRRWLCQCDCGNIHEATTGNLKSGHATNCGCGKSPDLSGQKFGQITVICRSENKRKRGIGWLSNGNANVIVVQLSIGQQTSLLTRKTECALIVLIKTALSKRLKVLVLNKEPKFPK